MHFCYERERERGELEREKIRGVDRAPRIGWLGRPTKHDKNKCSKTTKTQQAVCVCSTLTNPTVKTVLSLFIKRLREVEGGHTPLDKI